MKLIGEDSMAKRGMGRALAVAAAFLAFGIPLAADTAQTEVPNLVELLEQKYAAALRDAKAEDARESSTPRDAWGRNHYVDAMHGIRQGGAHLPRHSFHGLV